MRSWMNRWRNFSFEDEWVIGVSVDTVWEGMVQVESWPEWWDGLELSTSTDGLPVGMAGKHYQTRWKGTLPYGLDVHAVIREAHEGSSISADIHGDIEGVCACRIEESPQGTRGIFSLDVRTANPWMTLLSPVLKGYFSENHKQIMAKGMHGFTRFLERRVAA